MAVPVNSGRRRKYDFFQVRQSAERLKKFKESQNVGLSVPKRLRDRSADTHLGSEMENDLRSFFLDYSREILRGNIKTVEFRLLVYALFLPRREIVNDDALETTIHESVNEVRADKASSSRNQYSSHPNSLVLAGQEQRQLKLPANRQAMPAHLLDAAGTDCNGGAGR